MMAESERREEGSGSGGGSFGGGGAGSRGGGDREGGTGSGHEAAAASSRGARGLEKVRQRNVSRQCYYCDVCNYLINIR